MDGLNLVAKEAPLVNRRDGVLVLSREAGAFEELGEWVVPVDPLDVEGQAAALERALGIPADVRRAVARRHWAARADARRRRVGRSRAARARRPRAPGRCRGYDALVSAGPDVASRELVSIDPATLEPLGRVPVTPPEELAEVVVEARLAQAAFAREPLEARSRLLERVVHALVEDADAIARTISTESGKPLAEAYAHELVVSADACRWHAENLGRLLREERLGFPQLVLRQKRGSIRYEPLGVVGIVTPWNFPLAIPLRQVAAAVAAGNAAVLKPSELTPLSGAWVEELFRRAEAPAGPRAGRAGRGRRRRGARPAPRHRAAWCSPAPPRSAARSRRRRPSGSVRPSSSSAGRTRCSCSTTPTSTVRSRARSGASSRTAVRHARASSGSPSRRASTTRSSSASTVRARELRIGRGADPGVELGPLVSEEQRARFEGLVADAVEHGAQVATGGGRPDTDLPGWFSEPTLLLRRAARRAAGRRGALRPGRHRCPTRQRRGDGALGERLAVRSRRQRVDARRGPRARDRGSTRDRLRVAQRPRVLVRRLADAVGRAARLRPRTHRLAPWALCAVARQARRCRPRPADARAGGIPTATARSTACGGCSAALYADGPARASAPPSTTAAGSSISHGRRSGERALARRRGDRRGADGRRRRQAGVATARRRARQGADGRDRPRRGFDRCRRATPSPSRASRGSRRRSGRAS